MEDDLNWFHGRNAVAVLREPVRLLGFHVDPLDAVALAAARRHHIHRVIAAPRLRWWLDS